MSRDKTLTFGRVKQDWFYTLVRLWNFPGLTGEFATSASLVILWTAAASAIVQLMLLLAAHLQTPEGLPEIYLQVAGRLVPLVLLIFYKRLSPRIVLGVLSATLFAAIAPWLMEGKPIHGAMTLMTAATSFCLLSFGTRVTLFAAFCSVSGTVAFLISQGLPAVQLWNQVGQGTTAMTGILMFIGLICVNFYHWQARNSQLIPHIKNFAEENRQLNGVALLEYQSLLDRVLHASATTSLRDEEQNMALLRLDLIAQEVEILAGQKPLAPINRSKVDIKAFLFGVKSRIQAMLSQRGVPLEFSDTGYPIREYRVDEHRLREVVVGLVRAVLAVCSPESKVSVVALISRNTDSHHEMRVDVSVDLARVSTDMFENLLRGDAPEDGWSKLVSGSGAPRWQGLVEDLNGIYFVSSQEGSSNGLDIELNIPLEPA